MQKLLSKLASQCYNIRASKSTFKPLHKAPLEYNPKRVTCSFRYSSFSRIRHMMDGCEICLTTFAAILLLEVNLFRSNRRLFYRSYYHILCLHWRPVAIYFYHAISTINDSREKIHIYKRETVSRIPKQ